MSIIRPCYEVNIFELHMYIIIKMNNKMILRVKRRGGSSHYIRPSKRKNIIIIIFDFKVFGCSNSCLCEPNSFQFYILDKMSSNHSTMLRFVLCLTLFAVIVNAKNLNFKVCGQELTETIRRYCSGKYFSRSALEAKRSMTTRG